MINSDNTVKPDTCENCKHFSLLVDAPESFGVCNWFKESYIPPVLPWWVAIRESHGSIHRGHGNCPTHARKGADSPKEKV